MCDSQASIKMIKTSVFDDMYSASINNISINKFQSDGGQKFVASDFIHCLAKLLFSFTICKLRSRSPPGDLPAGSPPGSSPIDRGFCGQQRPRAVGSGLWLGVAGALQGGEVRDPRGASGPHRPFQAAQGIRAELSDGSLRVRSCYAECLLLNTVLGSFDFFFFFCNS